MIGVGKIKHYTNLLEKPLSRGRQEVSLSAYAFLFSELVQYNQTQVDNIAELERRLQLSLKSTLRFEGLKMQAMLLEQEFLNFFVIEKRAMVQRKGVKLSPRHPWFDPSYGAFAWIFSLNGVSNHEMPGFWAVRRERFPSRALSVASAFQFILAANGKLLWGRASRSRVTEGRLDCLGFYHLCTVLSGRCSLER